MFKLCLITSILNQAVKKKPVFDVSTSPDFSDKCRDESLICFLKSGCATAFFKKSAFVFGIKMPH